jgi:hypothetical protein
VKPLRSSLSIGIVRPTRFHASRIETPACCKETEEMMH